MNKKLIVKTTANFIAMIVFIYLFYTIDPFSNLNFVHAIILSLVSGLVAADIIFRIIEIIVEKLFNTKK